MYVPMMYYNQQSINLFLVWYDFSQFVHKMYSMYSTVNVFYLQVLAMYKKILSYINDINHG